MTMTLDEIKRKKQEMGYSVDTISRLSGVPKATLQKVFSGATKSPRHETLVRLSAVLEDHKTIRYADVSGSPSPSILRDGPAASAARVIVDNPYGNKMQGQYTVEDYLALPDDKRYELIDGVIYEMASPTSNHQEIAGFMYYCFRKCADAHHLSCHPYIAPLDVQLDKDNKTMVQPDVIVICDPRTNIGKRMFGAPDFVAEVLSPTSRNRDIYIKLNKYKHAGVREYWILEPEKQKVITYLFDKDDDIRLYTFDDDIPVDISDGLCTVNFTKAKEWLV